LTTGAEVEGMTDHDADEGDHGSGEHHGHGDDHDRHGNGGDESHHGDDGHHAHGDDGHHAHDVDSLGFAVLTVTTSRSVEEDPSGDRIADLVEGDGHEVIARKAVADNYDDIQGTVDGFVSRENVDAVVTTGGTGVTPDDVTPEAVRPLLDKELPGFGELFRRLSYEEIGTMVVGTRAVGGVSESTPVFCLPGSESAVRLGVEEIVLPEIGHLAGLARRD
jgi:molybdenum cofactor biosynthesis protein B